MDYRASTNKIDVLRDESVSFFKLKKIMSLLWPNFFSGQVILSSKYVGAFGF